VINRRRELWVITLHRRDDLLGVMLAERPVSGSSAAPPSTRNSHGGENTYAAAFTLSGAESYLRDVGVAGSNGRRRSLRTNDSFPLA
jgi:hypothetical protein